MWDNNFREIACRGSARKFVFAEISARFFWSCVYSTLKSETEWLKLRDTEFFWSHWVLLNTAQDRTDTAQDHTGTAQDVTMLENSPRDWIESLSKFFFQIFQKFFKNFSKNFHFFNFFLDFSHFQNIEISKIFKQFSYFLLSFRDSLNLKSYNNKNIRIDEKLIRDR